MNTFALEIEYLTGYAVATDAVNRERPEWPPHPARVYMALAAAHFETDGTDEQKRAERAALEWLATLAPPSMSVPEEVAERTTCTVYVPVNDDNGTKGLGVLPTSRSRQPRTFPRIYVGDQRLCLIWEGDQATPEHLSALKQLSRSVTRIGHSSSLVWVRLLSDAESPEPTHTAEAQGTGGRLRVATTGELGRLEACANFSELIDYRQLADRAKSTKGKAKKQITAQLEERFPHGEPASNYPTIALGRSYVKVTPTEPDIPHSLFDPNFIVLCAAEGNPQRFGLESTLQLVTALRGAILKKTDEHLKKSGKSAPAWVSGHNADGSKLEDGGHMALIPLPFVGHDYADGHIMGLGIVIPHDVRLRDRAKALGPMLFDEETNQPNTITLTMGRAGVFKVVRDTSFSPMISLRPGTWTRPCHRWRSVTPIVLDRMPKTDRQKQPEAWREEVVRIIGTACENIGLPQPISVRVEKTPLVRGSLRAMPGQSGFALIKPGTFQVHAEVIFDKPVLGPMLLGAGRFRGYGLCRPMNNKGEAR